MTLKLECISVLLGQLIILKKIYLSVVGALTEHKYQRVVQIVLLTFGILRQANLNTDLEDIKAALMRQVSMAIISLVAAQIKL